MSACKKDTQSGNADYFVGTYITNSPGDTIGANVKQVVISKVDGSTLRLIVTGYGGQNFSLNNCKITTYSSGDGFFNIGETDGIAAYPPCLFAFSSVSGGTLSSNTLVFTAVAQLQNGNCNTGNVGGGDVCFSFSCGAKTGSGAERSSLF